MQFTGVYVSPAQSDSLSKLDSGWTEAIILDRVRIRDLKQYCTIVLIL